jgi:hypothetical protein
LRISTGSLCRSQVLHALTAISSSKSRRRMFVDDLLSGHGRRFDTGGQFASPNGRRALQSGL